MNSDFNDLLSLFNQFEVEYVVAGGYAVMFHTEPRYTKDLDLFVGDSKSNLERLAKAMDVFGISLTEQNLLDMQKPKQMIVLGVPPNRIDILNDLGGLDFGEVWNNRVQGDLDGTQAAIIDLKSLIKAKEMAGRPQDKLDLKKLRDSLQKK